MEFTKFRVDARRALDMRVRIERMQCGKPVRLELEPTRAAAALRAPGTAVALPVVCRPSGVTSA